MRPKEMQNLCSLKIGSLWPEFILASYHECRVELRPGPRPGEATRMPVGFFCLAGPRVSVPLLREEPQLRPQDLWRKG